MEKKIYSKPVLGIEMFLPSQNSEFSFLHPDLSFKSKKFMLLEKQAGS